MFWYILAGVLVCLVLLALIPLSLTVRLKEDGTLCTVARVFVIPVYRSPKRARRIKLSDYTPEKIEKRRKKQQKKQQKALKKQKKRGDAPQGSVKKKRSLSDLSDQISHITDLAHLILKRSLNHANVDVKSLAITVGSDDAAKTAVLYGSLSAALACLTEALHAFSHLRIRHVEKYGVAADFCAERIHADIHIRFRLRLWQVVDIALHTLAHLIRKEMKKATKKR